MSLLCLPVEIVVLIADYLEKISDVNAFVQTHSRLHTILNHHLYRRDARETDGSALLWAAIRGLLATFEYALRESRNAGTRNKAFHTILKNDYFGLAVALLDSGVDPEAEIDLGLSPLQIAIAASAEQVARLLISKGVDVQSKYQTSSTKCTPLHMACYNGLLQTVEVLLEAGADLHALDSRGQTPLHWCAKARTADSISTRHFEIASLLLHNGVKRVSYRDDMGRTPFALAKKHSDRELTVLLCDSPTDIYEAGLLPSANARRLCQEKYDIWQKDQQKRNIIHRAAVAKDGAPKSTENVPPGYDPIDLAVPSTVQPVAAPTRAMAFGKGAQASNQMTTLTPEACTASEPSIMSETSSTLALLKAKENALRWTSLREKAERRQSGEESGRQRDSTSQCSHKTDLWLMCNRKGKCQICDRSCKRTLLLMCTLCNTLACMDCKQVAASGTGK